MERTSPPDILKGVEKVLRDRLSTVFQQDFTAAGGIPTIVDILNRVDRGTEKHILEELEKEDAELAEEIRQQMFILKTLSLWAITPSRELYGRLIPRIWQWPQRSQ